MSEAEYVLCEWKNRLWPAKVLSKKSNFQTRRTPKNELACLCVEILTLNKQVPVRSVNTQPLKEETLEAIAATLDPYPKPSKHMEELVYRRALREALDILNTSAEAERGGGLRQRRRGEESGQKSPPSLVPYCKQLSFPEEPPERESRAKITGREGNGSDIQQPPKCQFSGPEFQDLSGNRDGASPEGEKPGTPPKLRPKPSTDGRTTRSRKRSRGDEGGALASAGTSTLALASPKSDAGSTPSGKSLAFGPGLGRTSPDARGPPGPADNLPSSRGNANGKESDLAGTPLSKSPPGVCREETPAPSPACCESQEENHPASPADNLAAELSNFSEGVAGPPEKYKKATRGGRQPSVASGLRRNHKMWTRSRGTRDGSIPRAAAEERQGVCTEAHKLQLPDFEESPSALPQKLSPGEEIRLSPAVKEEEEEDEELPRVLWYEEATSSFEAGMLVWCKLRRFPYWPAVVKNVNRKTKKASVVFIEKAATDKKAKGFSISFRSLKHFDCEEKQKLINDAKEKYRDEISWTIDFIIDYRLKVAGEMFAGSVLDYFASYSTCKKTFRLLYPVASSKREETDEDKPASGAADDSKRLPEASPPPPKPAHKLLPDRSRAARDKANERMVQFIVKSKGADEHLWAILRREKASRWLREFLAARPYYTCTETYLEDERQQEQVLCYLRESFEEASVKMLPLPLGGGIQFILDVMFPEAVIWAISAVDNLDYKAAEAKYLRGPLVSQRERKEFEEGILEKKRELELRGSSLLAS